MQLPIDQLLKARKASGKSLLSLLLEIRRLRKGEGQVGLSEYFEYQLYDDNRLSDDDKGRFVGWRMENTINRAFNKEDWAALSLDKILFYSFMRGAGLPIPKVRAIVSAGGRFLEDATVLDSVEAFADYLRNDPPYPLFMKPSHGNFGEGANLLAGYEADGDMLLFADGSKREVSEFVQGLDLLRTGGQIIQEVFTPHPQLAEICGPRASTVRVVIAMTSHGPKPISAVWKIPTGSNVIDNFHHGSTGNLVSSVDINNGRIKRVVGMNDAGDFNETSKHPDTGKDLLGATLPEWDRIIELCGKAAIVLPGLRLLHFDVALTASGPQILEVNKGGNIDLHQFASGKGFLTEELRQAMRDQEDYKSQMHAARIQTKNWEGGTGA